MAEMSQQEINRTLLKEIERLRSIHEVQELMSRYFHYHAAGHHKDCYNKLFAKRAPDVSAEIANWGKWEGPEAVRNFFYNVLSEEGDHSGEMFVHALDTACIQVAGDGKTAKGVWFSPGHETAKNTGKLQALWCWSYVGTDFIKEDGEWKIWHYHCYAMFRTPFEKSWIEGTMELSSPTGPITMPEHLKPNKSYTYFNEYTPASVRELVPEPPEPYETFDPTKAY